MPMRDKFVDVAREPAELVVAPYDLAFVIGDPVSAGMRTKHRDRPRATLYSDRAKNVEVDPVVGAAYRFPFAKYPTVGFAHEACRQIHAVPVYGVCPPAVGSAGPAKDLSRGNADRASHIDVREAARDSERGQHATCG